MRDLARRLLKESPGKAYRLLIERSEGELILAALLETEGNLAAASRMLGITRPTLRSKMRRYGIVRRTKVQRA